MDLAIATFIATVTCIFGRLHENRERVWSSQVRSENDCTSRATEYESIWICETGFMEGESQFLVELSEATISDFDEDCHDAKMLIDS